MSLEILNQDLRVGTMNLKTLVLCDGRWLPHFITCLGNHLFYNGKTKIIDPNNVDVLQTLSEDPEIMMGSSKVSR